MGDPICNERGTPESDCPPHCRHDNRSAQPESDDAMCPNCVTPWKCNGPHLAEPEAGR